MTDPNVLNPLWIPVFGFLWCLVGFTLLVIGQLFAASWKRLAFMRLTKGSPDLSVAIFAATVFWPFAIVFFVCFVAQAMFEIFLENLGDA